MPGFTDSLVDVPHMAGKRGGVFCLVVAQSTEVLRFFPTLITKMVGQVPFPLVFLAALLTEEDGYIQMKSFVQIWENNKQIKYWLTNLEEK